MEAADSEAGSADKMGSATALAMAASGTAVSATAGRLFSLGPRPGAYALAATAIMTTTPATANTKHSPSGMRAAAAARPVLVSWACARPWTRQTNVMTSPISGPKQGMTLSQAIDPEVN